MREFLYEGFMYLNLFVFLFIAGATITFSCWKEWENSRPKEPLTPEEAERWEQLLKDLREAQRLQAKEKSTR